MKRISTTTLIFSLILTTACAPSKGPSDKTAASASANSSGAGNGGIPGLPQLNAAQVAEIAKVIGQLVSGLFNSLSGLPAANFSSGQQSVANTLACPIGGAATLTGAGNLSVGGTFSNPQASVTGGAGGIQFNGCTIQVSGVSIILNGSLSLTGVTGTGGAVTGVTQATFTSSGSGNTAGNLSVGVGGAAISCAVATTSTLSASGTVTYNPLRGTGNISTNTSGSVCSLPVSAPLTYSF